MEFVPELAQAFRELVKKHPNDAELRVILGVVLAHHAFMATDRNGINKQQWNPF
ncbi:hypothetical protein QOT17_017989 [Balamuthia mandrillaris]